MKKLIETGFDEPNTDWLQKNIDEIANAPFSGIVVVCKGEAEDGKKINLRGAFCATFWHYHWFNNCLQDLEVTKPTHLKDNFIPIGVTPGNVDWFDEDAWKNVIEHWRFPARLAEEGGMKGILFDPEPYSNNLWQFNRQNQYHSHTFDEYRDKARKRGGEVMKAIKDEYPDMTLFYYFMNSRIFLLDAGVTYGLYPAFIDGWLDEAPAEMKFVDGCEDAYLYTTKKQFHEAARLIKEDCQLLVSNENRAKYRAQVQVSFGIYLDAYVNEGPDWYIPPKDGSRLNQFRDNLLDALSFADEYVWIYGEDYRWWSTDHPNVKPVYWDQILPGVDATLRFAYAADAATYSYPNVVTWMLKTGFKTEKEMRLWCSVNYIAFWSEMAKTYADWFEPWSSILEWKPPYARWFLDAKCNIAHNCVDRHAKGAKKDKVAYIFVPESTDQPTQRITYRDLYKEVNKLANGLKSLGVQKGDIVMIYMPMIPQLPIAMLACAKIGAIHSVVFSGFSSGGLNSRIMDAEAKVVITVDGFYRRGKPLALKPNVDEATANTPSVQKVVVYKRTGVSVPMKEGKDIWWDDLVAGKSDVCECEKMDSEDRLFILYSSGTTGKPKGIEHVHGGYCVTPAQTLHWVFDIKDNDVWWCTTDIGWITGHSYVVYGPLSLGATSIIYEGSPDFPDFGRWFQIIQDNKVSKFYSAPTAVRMLMKAGEQWPNKFDLSSLKILGLVGEPLDPKAWSWYERFFGSDKCPIMYTWWVTESGCFLISPLPITKLKPGSPTLPLPGFNIDVIDEGGNPVPPGTGGNIVINTPWPSMLRAFYKDSVRYQKEYWSTYWDIRPGTYLAGDKATKDEDGYFFIQFKGG